MFLKPNRKKSGGVTYEYWTLVESVRTSAGPRQRTVATLGKLPGLDEETRLGWEHIRDVLDGRLHQLDLLGVRSNYSAEAHVATLAVLQEPDLPKSRAT